MVAAALAAFIVGWIAGYLYDEWKNK